MNDGLSSKLRHRRRTLLQSSTPLLLQVRTASAVSTVAERWLSKRSSPPDLPGAFPGEMVWLSLAPLLESLRAASVWDLIDREQVRGVLGPEVIGHIIAGNTPLLPITSVVRALLVCSGSIVKMPIDVPSNWLDVFLGYLREADESVAELIDVYSWPRSDQKRNAELYSAVDLVVAYGADESIEAIRREASIPVVGYGHRVSVGIIAQGAIEPWQIAGLATDILMYDQTGCLSPHTIFVEGDGERMRGVAAQLAEALRNSPLPLPYETPERAARISEYRAMVSMSGETTVVDSEGYRWTVVVQERPDLHVSCTHGVINVVRATKAGIIEVLSRTQASVQGIVLVCDSDDVWRKWSTDLQSVGIKYLCHPGTLQMPTIHWREDNSDILRILAAP